MNWGRIRSANRRELLRITRLSETPGSPPFDPCRLQPLGLVHGNNESISRLSVLLEPGNHRSVLSHPSNRSLRYVIRPRVKISLYNQNIWRAPYEITDPIRRSALVQTEFGPTVPPTAAPNPPLKLQSFACSGVGVGSFGAILLCTPDTHKRWCVTSQIYNCNGKVRYRDVSPRAHDVPRNTEQRVAAKQRELTSIREATVRAPKEVVVLTMFSFVPLRTSIPCIVSVLPELRPVNGTRQSATFSEGGAERVSGWENV